MLEEAKDLVFERVFQNKNKELFTSMTQRSSKVGELQEQSSLRVDLVEEKVPDYSKEAFEWSQDLQHRSAIQVPQGKDQGVVHKDPAIAKVENPSSRMEIVLGSS